MYMYNNNENHVLSKLAQRKKRNTTHVHVHVHPHTTYTYTCMHIQCM